MQPWANAEGPGPPQRAGLFAIQCARWSLTTMHLPIGTRLAPLTDTAKVCEDWIDKAWPRCDTTLDRDLALKVAPDAFTSDPDQLARFEPEVKVLTSPNHPNIGSICGLEDADGVRALVRELDDGMVLSERIAQGPIPLNEVLPKESAS